jgi:4'-phosphopantetheinyl transferase
LAADEIHVWRTTLDWPVSSVCALSQILSADEQEKAARFHFEEDRLRAIIGRGLLRTLLGHIIDLPPARLRFVYGHYGKPELVDDLTPTPLGFNISHSGNLILLAIARTRAVGIDVEQIRTNIEWQAIAAHYFSVCERRLLATLMPEAKADAFFACWTRKEAYIKARGGGLSLPLDQFDVTLLPGQPAQLLRTRQDPGEYLHWQLHDLDLGDGYKAAVAAKTATLQLRCWNWSAGDIPEAAQVG